MAPFVYMTVLATLCYIISIFFKWIWLSCELVFVKVLFHDGERKNWKRIMARSFIIFCLNRLLVWKLFDISINDFNYQRIPVFGYIYVYLKIQTLLKEFIRHKYFTIVKKYKPVIMYFIMSKIFYFVSNSRMNLIFLWWFLLYL